MDTACEGTVQLKGGTSHITEDPRCAYRVADGTVYVYIVPLKNDTAGRRCLIYEAHCGDVIPSFYFKDMDHCTWSFCLVAAAEATLVRMEGAVTSPLKKRFAAKAGIRGYEQEGYENGLVDLYRITLVREDSFLMRTKNEKRSMAQNTDELIDAALKGGTDAGLSHRPLAHENITSKAFLRFCLNGIRAADIIGMLVLTVLSALLGLLLPVFTQRLYDTYIPQTDTAALFAAACFVVAAAIVSVISSFARGAVENRISYRVKLPVQNAVYHRLFRMPEYFIRDYDTADLAGRAMTAGEFAGGFAQLTVSLAAAAVCFIFCLCQMFCFSAELSLASLAMFAVYTGIAILCANISRAHRKALAVHRGRADSMMYQLLSGIARIRVSGVEDRAAYEYMKPYVQAHKLNSKAAAIAGISTAFAALAEGLIFIGMIAAVFFAPKMSIGLLAAFSCSAGAAFIYVRSLAGSINSLRDLLPVYDRFRPILEQSPENSGGKQLPSDADGSVSIEHVAFSYNDEDMVFSDLSINIRSGEYVGIVGGSGCGKSTLMKLLLGFERPDSGKIYYSGADMETLDLKTLRKRFGVVLQDGKLIAGSIYDNIVITAPDATPEAVMRAIELVGLREDIDKMPMGLHTVLSEDSHAVSGGQRQRILIARAIINDPQILFLDEATGALDNVSQAMICDALAKMICTRIVIAHRLSTIRGCDRILVLNDGDIAEQGTYEQLMNSNGIFRQLAERQTL